MFIEIKATDTCRFVRIFFDLETGQVIKWNCGIEGYSDNGEVPNKNMKINDCNIFVHESSANILRDKIIFEKEVDPVVEQLVKDFMNGEVACLWRLPHSYKDMSIPPYGILRQASRELDSFRRRQPDVNERNFFFRNGEIKPKWHLDLSVNGG
jgi:hypothetical protein